MRKCLVRYFIFQKVVKWCNLNFLLKIDSNKGTKNANKKHNKITHLAMQLLFIGTIAVIVIIVAKIPSQ